MIASLPRVPLRYLKASLSTSKSFSRLATNKPSFRFSISSFLRVGSQTLINQRSNSHLLCRVHSNLSSKYRQPCATSHRDLVDSSPFSTMAQKKKAILLGVFENADNKDSFILTPNATKVNAASNGLIEKNINILGPLKKFKARIFYGLTQDLPIVAVVGLGPNNAGINELEELDEKNENIRAAIASGVRSLRDLGAIDEVDVDSCDNATSAAEGAALGLYYFDELKSAGLKKPQIKLNLIQNDVSDEQKWNLGCMNAAGQNLCRSLEENPANIMTPTAFAKIASDKLGPLGVTVIARDQTWAESMKMGSFLSVTRGSAEPCVFLEMHYNNAPANSKPVVFVGKGITFDSGGISLKPSSNMDKMRADMGGAANVLSTIFTLASKKAPINIIGLTPLTENMPGLMATKPGDTVRAMNGKTIQIDNTDAEGRLVLADALVYAHQFDPLLILDIATLTGAMNVALGSAATGVFTNTSKYWNLLNKCGQETGDRVWRMPIFNHYSKQIADGASQLADLNNIGKYPGAGGCCIAAAFLREFVTHPNWLHLDIAGVMDNKDEVSYISKGMSGRPMRTLVKFVEEIYKNKLF